MKPQLPFFNYTVRNQTGDSIDIAIEGLIVDADTQQMYQRWFDDNTSVSFKSFRDQINLAVANGVKTINGIINSPGGQVTEAMAIHDFVQELQDKDVTVNMKGTGIVASAATYILMASRNSTMTANSWFMVHNVSGFAYGDVNEVESQAKTLRKFNDSVRDFYSNATGLPKETVSALMNKETWMTAAEAKDKGFIKCVAASAEFTNAINPENWLFNNRTVLNAYNSSIKNSPEMDFSKITTAIETGIANMLAKLGISNTTEGANQEAFTSFSTEIVNAIKEAVPDEERIQKMVDDAVGNSITKSLETLPESISNAISEAVKNTVTKDELKKVTDELAETQKSIANRTAGTGTRKDKPENVTAEDHPGITWGDE